MQNKMDVLILNRNLKSITDNLVESLLKFENIGLCGVIDSGSRTDEISSHTVVRANSTDATEHGLRPSRGFNLGIDWWLSSSSTAEWLMLLPNDSEVLNFDLESTLQINERVPNLAAIVPVSSTSHYARNFGINRFQIAWHFDEGPIILSRYFLKLLTSKGTEIFDPNNFRGYLSFIELSTKIYASNKCMIATDLISFKENKAHTIRKFELIGTEPYSKNIELMLQEGKIWLQKKYGFDNRKSLELISRLLFEEFLTVNESRMK
jgi:hypothetical protein